MKCNIKEVINITHWHSFAHMCKSHKCVVIPLVVSNAKKIRYFFFHSLLVLPVEMTGRQNATNIFF